MKRIKIKAIGIICLFITAAGMLCACDRTTVNEKELITQTIEAYLTSVKNHDIKKTSEMVHGVTVIFDPNDEELLQSVYYTIEDCYLESIDFPETGDLSHIALTVHYCIVYSDDYIPIGSRTWGKNDIKELFFMEKQENQYIITGIQPIFDW